MYNEDEEMETNETNDDVLESEERDAKSPSEDRDAKSPTEDRDCKSPTEASYGDDESKEEEEPRKRRTRRNVRVEEGDEDDVIEKKGSRRVTRQSSSEDEFARSRTRTSSGTKKSTGRTKVSSSEDEVAATTTRRKVSVKDRTKSFEGHSSGSDHAFTSSTAKRSSFSNRRANTVATSSEVASKRESFSKDRATSVETEASPRRLSRRESSERPAWSSSTKVDHGRVEAHTMSRKESTTQSESDEPKSATQLRARFEQKGRANSKDGHNKTRAVGGSTGAAALKARFESQGTSSFKRRTSSSSGRDRNMSTDDEDGGGHKKMSTLSLKARFEAKAADNAPVKRNFIINKNRTSSAARKFNNAAPASNKCAVCNKTVYPMEKLEANSIVYHKFCFKCTTCNRTVGLGSYAALQGKIYCKPHLKQLFKLKGNYDEGFGRAQRKTDWIKKDESVDIAEEKEDAILEQLNEQDVVVNGDDMHDD